MDPSSLAPQESANLGDSPEVQQWRAQRQHYQQDEGAYSRIQGTRPQTLTYGLNDSPTGLAGWIVEKFRAWSDCQGDVERAFSKGVTIFFRAGQTLSPLRCLMLRASHDLKCKRCRESLLFVLISCREKWAEPPEKPFHILAYALPEKIW